MVDHMQDRVGAALGGPRVGIHGVISREKSSYNYPPAPPSIYYTTIIPRVLVCHVMQEVYPELPTGLIKGIYPYITGRSPM